MLMYYNSWHIVNNLFSLRKFSVIDEFHNPSYSAASDSFFIVIKARLCLCGKKLTLICSTHQSSSVFISPLNGTCISSCTCLGDRPNPNRYISLVIAASVVIS